LTTPKKHGTATRRPSRAQSPFCDYERYLGSILVVEDDPIGLSIAISVIKAIFEADTGEEALSLLHVEHRPPIPPASHPESFHSSGKRRRPVSDWSLRDISEKVREIDFAMLLTHTEGGDIAGRPMSNNRDVEYDGDSFFFTLENTRLVDNIERDSKVALSYAGSKGLLGQPPVFICMQGEAELIRAKAEFEAHWVRDLERWFQNGVDTPGLVLIKVRATRIHYWDGENEGEVVV
jgi:general stress protein 26